MKNTSYLMLIMLLVFSCKQEELVEEMTPPTGLEEMTQFFELSFNSKSISDSVLRFIVLSDDSGETLFDTLGPELDVDINLQIDSDTDVHVTFGSVTEEGFNIVTYNKVKSGSQLNQSLDWEMHPCFQSGPVDGTKAILHITDLDDFYETINSIRGSDSDLLELKGDTLKLEGTVSSFGDISYQVAIRERENSELKSLVIPKKDWTWHNESQSMSHTVSFNDFSSTNEHVIVFDRIDKWSLDAKICDEEGRVVATQARAQNSKLKDDHLLKIYLNQDVEFNELKLVLVNNNYPGGYTYNWIYESMPDQIFLDSNRDPEFTRLEVDEFEIKNTYEYNLNVLTYKYGGSTNWTIIGQGGENVSFVKPVLPSQLHENYSNLKDILQDPYGVINTMYRTEGVVDDITKVHNAVIPRNKNSKADFNYSSTERLLWF